MGFGKFPITRPLKVPGTIGRSRIKVINEHDAMPNKYFVFDVDSLTNKRVRLYFALLADGHPALDFHERANLRFITDSAAINVNEIGMKDFDVTAHLYVC